MCFYDLDMPYDVEGFDIGLLRGPLLIAVSLILVFVNALTIFGFTSIFIWARVPQCQRNQIPSLEHQLARRTTSRHRHLLRLHMQPPKYVSNQIPSYRG